MDEWLDQVPVTTAEVARPHPVRIILPPGYWEDPTRRYPVLYFLHGSPDSPANHNYPALRSSTSMITVIPDGVLALLQAASGTPTAMSNAAARWARAIILGSIRLSSR